MSKSQFVRDLERGVPVDSRFCVLNPQPCSGNRPFKLTLRDRTGDIAAILWPRCGVPWSDLRDATYADVKGMTERNDYSGDLQVSIREFRPVDDPGPLADYLPSYSGEMRELYAALSAFVNGIAEPSLRALLRRLLSEDKEFRQAYYHAPAAQSMHHAYVGGLLEHSLEVARICDAVARSLPGLNRDVLVTAALLHDIGKIDEIDRKAPDFSFTRTGGMLGHVFLGARKVYDALASLEDCPDDLADALCHLLLSHQGKYEWGSPVLPCFREAYVLHLADDLSAKSYRYREAQDPGEKEMFRTVRGIDGRVYTRSLSWETPDPAESPEIVLPFPEESAAPSEAEAAELPDNVLLLPILGSVAAGHPSEEREIPEGSFPMPKSEKTRQGDYFLRISGDSMIEAHLLDGDLVHVRPQKDAKEGDIVVALVGKESTVKYLASAGGRRILRPANPDYDDIVPSEEEGLEIQGRVIGVVRTSV
jgi:3'-5' exoribonuclease